MCCRVFPSVFLSFSVWWLDLVVVASLSFIMSRGGGCLGISNIRINCGESKWNLHKGTIQPKKVNWEHNKSFGSFLIWVRDVLVWMMNDILGRAHFFAQLLTWETFISGFFQWLTLWPPQLKKKKTPKTNNHPLGFKVNWDNDILVCKPVHHVRVFRFDLWLREGAN